MTDITPILEAIIGLIALILTAFVIPFISKKIGAENMKTLTAWLEIACKAAEEAARAGLISKTDKYDYALEFLNKQGITFDPETMQALIDSTAHELFNKMKEESNESTDESTDVEIIE